MFAYNPDRSKKQTNFNATSTGPDGANDDRAVELCADTNTNYAKVHECQRPEPPVQKNKSEVFQAPGSSVVDASEVVIVDDCILSSQSFRARREPPEDAALLPGLARRKRPVRQPPNEYHTKGHADQAVYQKHPAKAFKPGSAVHELKPSRDKTYDGSRDL